MNVKEAVELIVDNMAEDDLINCWNEFCEDNKWYEDIIYQMDELDLILENKKPSEILYMVEGNDFEVGDKYFNWYGYNNIRSCNSLLDYYDTNDLKEWIKDQEYMGTEELKDLFKYGLYEDEEIEEEEND